jgi:arsenate reductase-like glutaredoxin family protein
MSVRYWGKANCDTCRAARALIRELARDLDLEVTERDYQKVALTPEEIDALVTLAGGVAAILSTRTAEARDRGWTAAAAPDRATFVAAAAANNNLVRRPVVAVGDRVVIGHDAPAIRALLGR